MKNGPLQFWLLSNECTVNAVNLKELHLHPVQVEGAKVAEALNMPVLGQSVDTAALAVDAMACA